MASTSSSKTPYRQIRALYDSSTITVYQAYSAEIATAAVQHQKLDASPAYKTGSRMTWIKPSWAWVLYRSGYSYKDERQTNILAIKMTHKAFNDLLEKAVLSHGEELRKSKEKAKKEGREKTADVRVQWDPERSFMMEKLEYRSIQIGIPGSLVKEWVDGIVSIEDVTERARELKRVVDEDSEEKTGLEELINKGLVPFEQEFVVSDRLREILKMHEVDSA
ncbi:hypothetical protein BDV96DRAFT_176150 [Lophiotrema nucula]|uniref:ATP-dependent RNA helicase DHX8 n=1 Tax=Lophiotrema nucula TaxID=690887 RepID=A0A6A5YX45_9PLEO|nr:hypothetical protein BDV96DRAFT_176150 [Lophiotrema nucula]